MYDALRAYVHPSAGSHLAIVGNSHLGCDFPILYVVEKSHHHGVGYDYARCFGLRLEEAERVPRLDYECLVLSEFLKILLYEPILHPVLAHLTGFAVSDELVRIKSDVETQIVVDHHLKCLAFDAFPFVLINRFCFKVALRTVTVAVYLASGKKLFHELGSELLVERFRNVT